MAYAPLRIDIDALRTAYRGLRWIGRGVALVGVLDLVALPMLLCHCTTGPSGMALVGRALVGLGMIVAGLRLGRAHRDGLVLATGLCGVLLMIALVAPSVAEVLSIPSMMLVAGAYHPRLAAALEHRARWRREG